MTRTLIALLTAFFVLLHVTLPASASAGDAAELIAVDGDVMEKGDHRSPGANSDQSSSIPPHASTHCHDSFGCLDYEPSLLFRETYRSPRDWRTDDVPPGFISQLVPPPR